MEPGLTLTEGGVEYQTDAGRIDLLAKDTTASLKMARPDRMITTGEVRAAIEHGELVEDYPDDPRGHRCLMLGCGEAGRAIHVVWAPKEEYLAIITAYLPDPQQWAEGFSSGSE